jgi:hypothetical protein
LLDATRWFRRQLFRALSSALRIALLTSKPVVNLISNLKQIFPDCRGALDCWLRPPPPLFPRGAGVWGSSASARARARPPRQACPLHRQSSVVRRTSSSGAACACVYQAPNFPSAISSSLLGSLLVLKNTLTATHGAPKIPFPISATTELSRRFTTPYSTPWHTTILFCHGLKEGLHGGFLSVEGVAEQLKGIRGAAWTQEVPPQPLPCLAARRRSLRHIVAVVRTSLALIRHEWWLPVLCKELFPELRGEGLQSRI